MNAKKIMGAVLVALLAAALFVGAGAAAEEQAAGTVFLYQASPAGIATGVYSYGDVSVEVNNDGVLPLNLEKFVDGAKYSNGTHYIVVKLPNAGFTAIGNPSGDKYDAMANGLISSQAVTFTATPVVSAPSVAVEAIIIFDENGVPTRYDATTTPDVNGNAITIPGNTLPKGTYQIQAILGDNGFVDTVEPAQLEGQKYSFVVYSTEPEITASADSVIMGNFITVTITGVPGTTLDLTAPGFQIIADKQVVGSSILSITDSGIGSGKAVAEVNLPNSGKAVVYLKAGLDSGKKTITVAEQAPGTKDAEVDVTIAKGVITAVADEDSYFIGNPIYLSGTTTAGSSLFFYIEGTNFEFTPLLVSDNVFKEQLEVKNGEWTAALDSSKVKSYIEDKKLIAGTYTIVVSTANVTDYADALSATTPFVGTLKEYVMDQVYGTAAVTMTQPFLTGIEANGVAIQGEDFDITGTAYSAQNVKIYVFGTNYFNAFIETVNEDETFEFTLDKLYTGKMAVGTYFYLIQHPMNDKVFNVWNGNITDTTNAGYAGLSVGAADADFFYIPTVVDASGAVDNTKAANFIFNAYERGTNYAAQALLEEISGQKIDDIFVQGTFEVEAQKIVINPIPAQVAKGTALTVSGTTNSGEGVEVIVNVLAGTFGATVKGDENAAVFLTAKAVTKEDGTFEAAIDTSKLELGNYIVTVELNGIQYDSAAVEIVEKAPVTPPADDKPDTPVTPPADDKPTEPETPGFGALAALAGLGAVAVLLLRRE